MEFRILGPTEVLDNRGLVPLPRGRGRLLLGVLLLRAGEVISTDRLIDELWGETPPPTVDTALQGLVFRLRRLLEPNRQQGEPPRLLLTRHPGYVLAVEPAQIDADRFRRLMADAEATEPHQAVALLRTALDLWRGPALADFTYEPFAQADIAALEELRLTAEEKRIEAELALGHHRELIGELERLVAQHPLRERLREHLMLGLYRSDRQGEALHVYSDLRDTLLEELGLDPAPSLQELEGRILRQDASLDLVEAVVAHAPEPWLTEERKMVTVLALDVAVSTDSGGEPDPETTRIILDRLYREASNVVSGHGGTAQRMLGSTLVGFYGIPVTREDDALRAVRAAVDLRHLITAINRELSPEVSLHPRTGIDTGVVVMGETPGDTTGGSVRSAGLLQREAGDGQILVGEATRLLIGKAALVQQVAAETSYGRSAWRVLDLAPISAVSQAETPIVGRKHELDELLSGYQRVVEEGRPYRLTVVGGPGIGKSRLAREIASQLISEALVLTGHCPSYGNGITFWPLREIVLAVGDGIDKPSLERLLGDGTEAAGIADHVLAAIGSAQTPARPAALFPKLRHFFEFLARSRPLVVILEDMHWAQATFLDLVEYLAEGAAAPIYLLCLARPELLEERPNWAEDSLELAPLGPAESRALAANRLSGRMVPAQVVDKLLETAQGNPLFVEQLAAAIGEQGDVSVPPTVEALLASRIDRLGPAERDLVRRASVLGHRFTMEALLWLLPDQARPSAPIHLRTLERKEFVVPLPSGTEFAFRHVLVQQAAYRSLTKQMRAHLHELAAGWMEDRPEQLEEAVGYHLEQSFRYHQEIGDPETKAQDLACQAGEKLAAAGLRAFGRFDAGGAENLLTRARALLPGGHRDDWDVSFRLAEAHETMGRHGDAEAILEDLAATASNDATRLTLELERAWVRFAIGPDPMSMDELADLARSALARYEDEDAKTVLPLFILGEVFRRSGRISEMESTLRRCLVHADRSTSTRYQLGARRMLATALEVGRTPVTQCIDECGRLLVLRGRENAAVLPILGRLYAMNSDVDLGRKMVVRAETLLREGARARRPLSLVWKRRAEVELLGGDLDVSEDYLRQAVELDMAMDIREEGAEAAALLSRVLFLRGRYEEAGEMAELSKSQAPAESITPQALWRSASAGVSAAAGEVEEAMRFGEEAIALVPPEMVNLRGDLHLDLARALLIAGQEDPAQSAIEKAINSYERKGNRAAITQARLLVAVGD